MEHDSVHANNLPAWQPRLTCDPISSPTLSHATFPWLTALTINNVDCSRQELVDLYKLKNLVALDICGKRREWSSSERLAGAYGKGNGFVDERLIWHWANHAYHDKAFSQLRVLIIRNEPAVTNSIAPFLVGLPALRLLGVQGCGINTFTDSEAFSDSRFAANSLESFGDDLPGDLNHQIALEQGWDGVLRICVQRTAAPGSNPKSFKMPLSFQDSVDSGYDSDSQREDEPSILNFRMGQTPSGTIFSKSIAFFHNSPKQVGPFEPQASVLPDWVFVPQGYLLPDRSKVAQVGCMAAPASPLVSTAPARPVVRSRAKVNLNDVLADSGIGSAPSAHLHGDVEMQRSTSIGEPASAFGRVRRNHDDKSEMDEVLAGTKGDRKRGFGANEIADGIVSAPGTPPRLPHIPQSGRTSKPGKKSLPLNMPVREASRKQSIASEDFTQYVDAVDLHTLFRERATQP